MNSKFVDLDLSVILTKWRQSYLPQYSDRGIVRSFYPVNVPFFMPTGVFEAGQHFRVLGDHHKIVLFRPMEWRGCIDSSIPTEFWNTPLQMASEISGFERGSVAAIYLTSDGGADLNDVYDMVALLDPHVEVLGPERLADMALAAHAAAVHTAPA